MTHYDAHAAELSQLLHDQHDYIADLIQQASARAGMLITGLSVDYVVCHTDAHAGNVLLADDAFYLVDWDAPLLALRERDLMFIGGGQGFIGVTPDEEWARFFSGYGDIAINMTALQYYRFERIITDMVLYCDDLLLTACGGANRGQALHNIKANFATGGTIERAYAALPI